MATVSAKLYIERYFVFTHNHLTEGQKMPGKKAIDSCILVKKINQAVIEFIDFLMSREILFHN